MEKRTIVGVWKAMSAVEDWARKSTWLKSFNKFVPIVNSKNGDAFFEEVLMLFHSFLLMLLTSYNFLHSFDFI